MAMASRWVWFIFQFPLMNGLRTAFEGLEGSAMLAFPQGLEARQVALLDEFQ
jgi:hypothetical protein